MWNINKSTKTASKNVDKILKILSDRSCNNCIWKKYRYEFKSEETIKNSSLVCGLGKSFYTAYKCENYKKRKFDLGE